MSAADVKKIHDSLNYAASAFGVLAVATPGTLASMYDLKDSGNLRIALRMWGLATLANALHGLKTDDPAQRRFNLQVTVGVTAGNVLAALGTRGDASTRSRLQTALSSAPFAGAALYALSQED